jgi:hypothetical protein
VTPARSTLRSEKSPTPSDRAQMAFVRQLTTAPSERADRPMFLRDHAHCRGERGITQGMLGVSLECSNFFLQALIRKGVDQGPRNKVLHLGFVAGRWGRRNHRWFNFNAMGGISHDRFLADEFEAPPAGNCVLPRSSRDYLPSGEGW